ncbi:hypothetical protein GE107_11840 [Cohnella sp. CFH 77786]|uniref:hypothetical protein n=1 Tax=Cohnella sp. CFH 77786 TaxID=2662265 RepID=UPI001C60C354|nr:hypothetical protein [Cohnella sp. CFH 77786]MBW5446753.1 hypothetical protein [Cohnella sp. CFH 77786]
MQVQFLDQRASVISQGAAIPIPDTPILIGDIGLLTAGAVSVNPGNARVELNAMIILADLAEGTYRIQILREGTPLYTADSAGTSLLNVNPPSYTVTDFPPYGLVVTGQIRYTLTIQRIGGTGGTVQGAFFGGSANTDYFT